MDRKHPKEVDFSNIESIKDAFGINPKQAQFAIEYVVDCNAQQAALRCGYSEKTAGSQGCRLLKNAKVREAIFAAQSDLAKRVCITEERIVQELSRIAFSNVSDFVQWDSGGVGMVDSDKLTRAQTAAISEIVEMDTANGKTRRFKLHDKRGALELLARHLGMLVERREISGPGGGPVEMKRSVEDLSDEELMEIIAKGKGEKE